MYQITPETWMYIIKRIGLPGAIILLIILAIFWFALENRFDKKLEKYKTELTREAQKNLEVWKNQKQLMFEFVDFLEAKLLNMPSDSNEKQKVFGELNRFYGKLYLILDTKIINKINEVLKGAVSPVQRYYIYREIREQLLSVLYGQEVDDKDCPYLSLDIGNVAVPQGTQKPKNFDDLKRIYPFVEKGDKENSYKGLPYFGEYPKQQ